MTFPLITIAAINGHCFAGGMLLALCCDYRLMTTGRGWMSMNEVSRLWEVTVIYPTELTHSS